MVFSLSGSPQKLAEKGRGARGIICIEQAHPDSVVQVELSLPLLKNSQSSLFGGGLVVEHASGEDWGAWHLRKRMG